MRLQETCLLLLLLWDSVAAETNTSLHLLWKPGKADLLWLDLAPPHLHPEFSLKKKKKKSPTDCEITYLIFNAFSPWKSMPPRDWPAREAGLSGTNSCQWADDPMALGDFKVPTRKSQERATTQLCLNLLVLKVGWTLESRGEWSKLLMVGDPGFNVQI